MYSDNWIHMLGHLQETGEACVIVTVLETKGSAPRDAGTKMLVTTQRLIATIGGGHLEHLATRIAREMLSSGNPSPRLERFNLGARLGQCCGGAVTLSFEPIGFNSKHLTIFGAGHVAQALVHIVSTLPFRTTWIDQREDIFPDSIPSKVTKLISDDPLSDVTCQPAGSYYLVMTHNHQLDFELTRAILDRGDSQYLGVIGSQSKRKRFEMRLAQRDYSQKQINTLICPIGLPNVNGKHPAEIAVSIAGELIMHYQGIAQEHQRDTLAAEHSHQDDVSVKDKIA
ncbi:xanthine dehydrogenase accessory protein XdhC [Vibrio zhanjiangensis]|uniref:Xanthine dehydrogenase accessory protein XdhC n=1 Tax=Vibrio zhanjiangensis TaxID=1046128 RepID=A0ABQ6F1N8_9VIBR|nr:xanthine dehydrogenase accessory protein XdhC [Vibrio zhanjiangensis]GLT19413.1 xanthine dehydrogenase accessory protein XdhC [Vibrio zhanjiangensis]